MSDTIESRWEQQNEAGRLSFTDGDYARAEQSFLAAIREATQLGADNVRLASSLSNLGQLKYKQKDLAQAETLFHRALAIRERVLGPDHFGLVQNINNLAALHYARGELEQAEPLFQRALAISEQHLGESHPDVSVTLNNLARLYFRRADYVAAAPLLSRLLAIKEQSLGANHPEIAAILTSLAKVRFAEGDYDGGEQFARRALDIRERLQLPNDLAVATALETLAEICGARGRIDEEMRHRTRALGVRSATMGADHPAVVAARAALDARRAAEESVALDDAPLASPTRLAAPPRVPPMPPAPPSEPPNTPVTTTRTTSLPWIEVPQPSVFKRMTPSSLPTHAALDGGNGGNGTVTVPLRNGNGSSYGATAIEKPESPLAFHPFLESLPMRVDAPLAPPAPASMSLPAPSAPIVVESPFTNSFARLVADTPPARTAITVHSPSPRELEPIPEARQEVSLDWPIEPRRPGLRIVLAGAAIAIVAGGGWYFFTRHEPRPATPRPAAVAPAPVRRDTALVNGGATRSALPAAPPKEVPSAAKSAAPDPVKAAEDARALAHATMTSAAPAGKAADREPDANAAPAPSSSKVDAISNKVDAISNKVDAITKMIDDSARLRADSVGRAISQKPPIFKPKVYPPAR